LFHAQTHIATRVTLSTRRLPDAPEGHAATIDGKDESYG
jgi:hypothetical protein